MKTSSLPHTLMFAIGGFIFLCGLATCMAGCTAVEHRAIGRIGSTDPHNVSPGIGLATEYESGAKSRVLWTPRLRVEDPSTRGEQRWLGGFLLEYQHPIWKAR